MMRRFWLCAFVVLLCLGVLFGCSNPEPSGEVSSNPSLTEHTDEASDGSGMYGELLEVLSWDSPRCFDSSLGYFAETEAGYYVQYGTMLYYADKSDLSNWVPLCTRADCGHRDTLAVDSSNPRQCDAYIGYGIGFQLRDDRIYFVSTTDLDAFRSLDTRYCFLASMALDGTDKRVEYQFRDLQEPLSGSQMFFDLTGEHFLMGMETLDRNGTIDQFIQVVDEEGEYQVFSGTGEEWSNQTISANKFFGLRGDTCYHINFIDGSYTTGYGIEDRQMRAMNLEGLSVTGSWLEGDTLRCFRTNEGYYDIDLVTRQETKLEEPRLSNSQARILQPNCILESTMMSGVPEESRKEVESHQLWLFNGRQWLEVALPEELRTNDGRYSLVPEAVASDRIILRLLDCTQSVVPAPSAPYYQILLGTDVPALEYMGTLRHVSGA